jgi:hypothetical protein
VDQPQDIDGAVANARKVSLFCLFAKGERPDFPALRRFAKRQGTVAVVHMPGGDAPAFELAEGLGEEDNVATTVAERGSPVTVQLVRTGLSFDLAGLYPGSVMDFPQPAFRFDCDALPRADTFEALELSPGRHIAGGARSIPVVKGLMATARDLAEHFPALDMLVWPASTSAIGRRYFESVISAWLETGAFPGLGLTAFRTTSTGDLESVGLDFWLQRELRLVRDLARDPVAATRLGVRLVNQLILAGGVQDGERFAAPDGRMLTLRLSPQEPVILAGG